MYLIFLSENLSSNLKCGWHFAFVILNCGNRRGKVLSEAPYNNTNRF